MKTSVYLLVLLAFNILQAGNEWEIRYSNTKEPIFDIQVIDSNISYVYSDNFSPFRILKTTDQGISWNKIYSGWSDEKPNCFSSPDENSLFLGCSWGVILKSLDGGKTFSKMYIDTIRNDFLHPRYISMYDENIGITSGNRAMVTKDGWNTSKMFKVSNDTIDLRVNDVSMINDSVAYSFTHNSLGKKFSYFLKLNINSFDYNLNTIDEISSFLDFCVIDNKIILACGKSNSRYGGSGHDAIYKSSDTGKTWRRVLDLYPDENKLGAKNTPFGLQSISFKDSLTGIAVGGYDKIIYTYDGGESWIYEDNPHNSILTTNTKDIRYMGSVPVMCTFHGQMLRMTKDNLAPKPEDTLTISGRVWEGTKGQAGIPIALNTFRITMTDSNGYYKFTRCSKGKHTVKAVNKHYDARTTHEWYYKPFDYTPEKHEIDLTHDTSGFDFNAKDLRVFYKVGGIVTDTLGLPVEGIEFTLGDSSGVSDHNGRFTVLSERFTRDITPVTKGYIYTPKSIKVGVLGDIDTLHFIAKKDLSGIEEETKVLLYPNPATDYIFIETDSEQPIQLYNTYGQLLNQYINIDKIDVSSLPTGIYFIRVKHKIIKFVKV